MSDLPLLLFPSPENADRTKRKMMPGKVNRPSITRQHNRLSPIFSRLQASFNATNVELQQTPSGIDPEQVLVIETVGGIEKFSNAVKKISGLEWMGEIETDDIVPDDDFYDENKPEKLLSGRLYLIMSNQTALNEMISLWNRYQADSSMVFERGTTKFRDVFLHLKDIRRWGVKDRLSEEEIFEIWKQEIDIDQLKFVRFEAELWYRKSNVKRNECQKNVELLIEKLGGNVISRCIIPTIAYHSILGEIPAKAASEILQQPEVDLLKCNNVMFFRPTGQMAIGNELIDENISDCDLNTENLPSGDPIIAVLDGLPLENHNLLAKRLIVDDPDDWASEYPAFDRQHGTAMTSLIIHGDLNYGSFPLSRPIYLRPIMKPNSKDFKSPREECIPDDILYVDYIHSAVKRMMEGYFDEDIPSSIKIINLSIGDRTRHFSQIMSPLARLLDWLSVKYNVLFIVSSGNHSDPIFTDMSLTEYENLDENAREALIVNKVYESQRHRRLLAPAESINSLTIGALHYDNTHPVRMNRFVDPFISLLPSPVSSFGTGYRSAIKPDLVLNGGKILLNSIYDSQNVCLRIPEVSALRGNRTAAPSKIPGEFDKWKFSCGTSNATALTTRLASFCYENLISIFSKAAPHVDFEKYSIPILKAMLIHGCSWKEYGEKLSEILNSNQKSRNIKKLISKWIGYGVPDISKVLACNGQRATLIGFGELKNEEAHVYKLPLPVSLNARRDWRKFTVTLAWISPIAPTTQKYRKAQLWFDFEDGKKSREKLKGKLRVVGIDNAGNTTRRGTVQHEIFEGESAVAIIDGDFLKIKVNCREDAQKIENPIPYGLIVSLEVSETIDLPIYNDIRTKIALPIEIRPLG